MGSSKDIVKKLLEFEEQKGGGYLCYIVMEGYEFFEDKPNCIIIEKLVLGFCKDKDLEKMISFFNTSLYDIEVKKL